MLYCTKYSHEFVFNTKSQWFNLKIDNIILEWGNIYDQTPSQHHCKVFLNNKHATQFDKLYFNIDNIKETLQRIKKILFLL